MKTTIGVPVYNEARLLANTLESIAGQADAIIICDNASTDGTGKICQDFASRHENVKYVRLKENRGAGASFRLCLELAETEYFMWVGGHDLLVPGYVARMRAILDQQPDVLLAYANALHLDPEYHYLRFYYYTWGHLLMSDAADIRVAAIVQLLLEDCTMFHGLYRKRALDNYFSSFHKTASVHNFYIDHVILAYIALQGKMCLSPFSNYIRIDPREALPREENWKRAIIASNPELPPDPRIFPMSVFKGQKAILDMLAARKETDKRLIQGALHTLMKIWGNFAA